MTTALTMLPVSRDWQRRLIEGLWEWAVVEPWHAAVLIALAVALAVVGIVLFSRLPDGPNDSHGPCSRENVQDEDDSTDD